MPQPTHALEVDMLGLGDADCILVTEWTPTCPCRVLIDGGSGVDASAVKNFLLSKNALGFYSIVCTHPHNDHAAGLAKIVQDKTFKFSTCWMHDIRKHVNPITLRREMAGSSAHATWVRQVVENTEELARAFASRGVVPREPFAGNVISNFPNLEVLGPDEPFYRETIEEFLEVKVPVLPTFSSYTRTASAQLLGLPSPPQPSIYLSALARSRVKENPKTQPFNNTSAVVGGLFDGHRLLFTGDAGAEALDRVPSIWRNLAWMQVPHHGSDGNLSKANIGRFCPRYAFISAKGDTNHPSRAIANGLIGVGTKVASTHKNNNMLFYIGPVTPPPGYGPLTLLKGTAARSAGFGRL
jgi:beta-lactamase superfamily II metal-dependent hydrolase